MERAIHLMAHEAPKICDPHLREEAIGLVGRKVMEVGGKIVLGGMRRDNAFKTMVACGSKGSNINILQVPPASGRCSPPSASRRVGPPELRTRQRGPRLAGLCPNHFVGGITSEDSSCTPKVGARASSTRPSRPPSRATSAAGW